MTDSHNDLTSEPGWYPDPSGSSMKQWWTGTEWTGQRYDPALEAYGATPPAFAGRGTTVDNTLLWAIVLLPIASLIAQMQFDTTAYLARSLGSDTPVVDPMYVLIQLLGFGILAASIVMAFLDYRRLSRLGVARPFHWAWTFLYSGIYVIGRTVIVRRRVGGSLKPVAVWAGLLAITTIVSVAKAFAAMSELGPALTGSVPS